MPLTAIVGLDYKTPGGDWSMGGSFNLRTNGLVRMDVERYSWANVSRQLDAYLAWKVDSKTQLRLSGWNLLKQDSRSRSIYHTDKGTLSSESVNYGVRNIRLQLEMRF